MRFLAIIVLGVSLISCGASPSTQPRATTTVVHIDRPLITPDAFLLRWVGRWYPVMAKPAGSLSTLEDAVDDARGSSRTAARLEYLLALAYAIDERREEEDALAMRHLEQDARQILRRTRRLRGDERVRRDFIELWMAWRSEDRNTQRLAERFIRRSEDSGLRQLHDLAYVLLGEAHFRRRRWDDASEAYRFLLGDLQHPLYAFAQWRTAQVHYEQGRDEDVEPLHRQIIQLACPEDAPPAVIELAEALATHLHIAHAEPAEDDEPTPGRFEICEGHTESGGMENELPPGFR